MNGMDMGMNITRVFLLVLVLMGVMFQTTTSSGEPESEQSEQLQFHARARTRIERSPGSGGGSQVKRDVADWFADKWTKTKRKTVNAYNALAERRRRTVDEDPAREQMLTSDEEGSKSIYRKPSDKSGKKTYLNPKHQN